MGALTKYEASSDDGYAVDDLLSYEDMRQFRDRAVPVPH